MAKRKKNIIIYKTIYTKDKRLSSTNSTKTGLNSDSAIFILFHSLWYNCFCQDNRFEYLSFMCTIHRLLHLFRYASWEKMWNFPHSVKRYSYIAYNTFSIITYFIYFICLFTFMSPIFWRSPVSMDARSSRLMTDIDSIK